MSADSVAADQEAGSSGCGYSTDGSSSGESTISIVSAIESADAAKDQQRDQEQDSLEAERDRSITPASVAAPEAAARKHHAANRHIRRHMSSSTSDTSNDPQQQEAQNWAPSAGQPGSGHASVSPALTSPSSLQRQPLSELAEHARDIQGLYSRLNARHSFQSPHLFIGRRHSQRQSQTRRSQASASVLFGAGRELRIATGALRHQPAARSSSGSLQIELAPMVEDLASGLGGGAPASSSQGAGSRQAQSFSARRLAGSPHSLRLQLAPSWLALVSFA